MSARVLVVDDDRMFAQLAASALEREGFRTEVRHSLHDARAVLENASIDLLLLDRRLPDGDGKDFLGEAKRLAPDAAVILITAHGDIQSAVEAVRAGAADYVTKPVELADVVMKARRATQERSLRARLERAETALGSRRRFVPPTSAKMKQVVAMLERIARSPRSPVLLLGETGVGKEVLARHVHASSVGDAAPFVHVNCAALPEAIVESELFGHERGAFTDARAPRRGLVELAHGGTLFLDEIGELPLSLQAKLLTFLDSGAFRRLGGTQEQTSSARVIAATHRNLEEDIRAGRFRQDLWFRLSVFRIDVPPLRERREDIVPMAQEIIAQLGAELGRRNVRLSELARRRLEAYPFPGNVRELRNVLERALVLEGGSELELSVLAEPGSAPPSAAKSATHSEGAPTPGGFHVDAVIPMDELERRYAQYVLEQLGGRRMDAAKALGLSYPTFLKRIGSGE